MNSALTAQFIAGQGAWQFGIGDPNAVSWCIVVAYALAAGLSFHAYFVARAGQRLLAQADPGESANHKLLKRLWLLVGVTMVVLGINKQLDLQTLLLQTARRWAYRGGWYGQRREYQAAFIVAIAIFGIIGTIALAVALRRVLRRVLLAVAGLGMLVVFVVIRAVSFHYVDRVLALGGQIRINWILEFSGIALIVASTLRWRYAERDQLAAIAPQITDDHHSSFEAPVGS